MSDALNQSVSLGSTVVYISKGIGGSVLHKGVVTKVNKRKHQVQPLRVRKVDREILHLFDEVTEYPDGKCFRPVDVLYVHEDRMAVMDGFDWPEYQEFIRNGWVGEPLDMLALD